MCIYTIVHLDTVFNAKNKIGIYLICYYIHNIYLSFLHLMLYGISFPFVLSSHIADIIWKILIIDVRKDTLRRAVSNQSAFSTYTKASIHGMKVKPLFITRVNIMSIKYLVVQEFAFCLYSKQEFVKLYLKRSNTEKIQS